jgi:hypothetical protein
LPGWWTVGFFEMSAVPAYYDRRNFRESTLRKKVDSSTGNASMTESQ